MKILINRGNLINAKSYPYWDELLVLLKDHKVKEIKGTIPIKEIIDLVNWCDTWVTIDTFLQHLCAFHKLKPGIVIWGKSDPIIFGYPHNINLLKSRDFLRKDQYVFWTNVPIEKNAFVSPQTVLASIIKK